jgi:hypothetical protein
MFNFCIKNEKTNHVMLVFLVKACLLDADEYKIYK